MVADQEARQAQALPALAPQAIHRMHVPGQHMVAGMGVGLVLQGKRAHQQGFGHHLNIQIARRVAGLKGKGQVLRFVGAIRDGRCTVGLAELPIDHPLARIREGENAVSFLTDRFQPIPLVVRGYGAGPAVTAAGVFADVLRTQNWKQEL